MKAAEAKVGKVFTTQPPRGLEGFSNVKYRFLGHVSMPNATLDPEASSPQTRRACRRKPSIACHLAYHTLVPTSLKTEGQGEDSNQIIWANAVRGAQVTRSCQGKVREMARCEISHPGRKPAGQSP